jgi:hypothetical protein
MTAVCRPHECRQPCDRCPWGKMRLRAVFLRTAGDTGTSVYPRHNPTPSRPSFPDGLLPMKLRDLRHDQPLNLRDAAEYLGKLTGQKPHVSTLWRWCLKGCKGVRLDSICIGSKRFVTAGAIERFVEALTAARSGPTERPSSPSSPPPPAKGMLARVMRHNDHRRGEIDAARRRLDEITGASKPATPATRSA